MQQVLVERHNPGDFGGEGRRRVRSVRVNIAESPLSWLHARGKLSGRQFLAGEMLRIDFEKAGLSQRTTMVWDAPPAGRTPRGAPDFAALTHVALDAKRRFNEAIAAAGPGLSDILWRVVCAGEGVPEAEKGLGWPLRSGRLVLTLALDRIAAYYRLPQDRKEEAA